MILDAQFYAYAYIPPKYSMRHRIASGYLKSAPLVISVVADGIGISKCQESTIAQAVYSIAPLADERGLKRISFMGMHQS